MEKFVRSLSAWLQTHDYKTVVIHQRLSRKVETAVSPSLIIKNLEYPEVRVYRKQVPYIFYMSFLLFVDIFKIFKIISLNKKFNFQVLHAGDLAFDGFAAVIASWIIKVPVISHCHGIRYYNLQKQLTGRKLAKTCALFGHLLEIFAVKYSKVIITVNAEARNFFISLGLAPEKIRVLPIGIDTSAFKETDSLRNSVRRKLRIGNDEVLICFIGRLDAEKNIKGLIEAYIDLLTQGRMTNSHLLIVGSGSLRNELEENIAESFKCKVIFTGARTDVPRLLLASDIFVLPSFFEGSPTALLEAMASGKAIVASDLRSIREIIKDEYNGLLVKPGDKESLMLI
jgi:glycosyltransferase involved in cell wall biosynthesis